MHNILYLFIFFAFFMFTFIQIILYGILVLKIEIFLILEIAYNNKKDIQMKTRIKELRLEKNLTQQTLAKHLGTNQTTLSKIECGLAIPDAMLLISLSNLFHVSTDYILCLSEERLSADSLLADNMHRLKKYQHFISLYQKMTPKQQTDFYNFLCSLLGNDENL